MPECSSLLMQPIRSMRITQSHRYRATQTPVQISTPSCPNVEPAGIQGGYYGHEIKCLPAVSERLFQRFGEGEYIDFAKLPPVKGKPKSISAQLDGQEGQLNFFTCFAVWWRYVKRLGGHCLMSILPGVPLSLWQACGQPLCPPTRSESCSLL